MVVGKAQRPGVSARPESRKQSSSVFTKSVGTRSPVSYLRSQTQERRYYANCWSGKSRARPGQASLIVQPIGSAGQDGLFSSRDRDLRDVPVASAPDKNR